MSLLSDILSKVKISSHKKDIPPHLKEIVRKGHKKSTARKRMIILLLLPGLFLISGIFAYYYLENFSLPVDNSTKIALKTKKDKNRPEAAVTEVEALAVFREDDLKETNKPAQNENSSTKIKKSKNEKTAYIDSYIPIEDEKAFQAMLEKQKTVASLEKEKYDIKMKAEEADLSADSAHENDRRDKPVKTESHEVNSAKKRTSPKQETYLGIRTKREKINYIDTIFYIAEDLERRGEYISAFNEYKKIVKIDKKNHKILNRMAFLLIKAGRNKEAAKYAEESVKIREDYVQGRTNLAIALSGMQMNDRAEEMFQKAIKIAPDNKDVLYNLAVFYNKNNRPAEAKEMYERFLSK